MDAQIFICAGIKEIPWLNCSLQSIQKYWTGEHVPIVAVPPECRHTLPKIIQDLRCIVILQPVALHEYIRMTADCYMTAQMVMFMDVHDMLTRACNWTSFTDENKRPIIATESYGATLYRVDADQSCLANRRAMVEDLLDFDSPYEYTGRDPIMFHRHSIRRAREMIEVKNKRPLANLLRNHSDEYFRSANMLGSYIWEREKEAYRYTPIAEYPQMPVRHFPGITDPTKGSDLLEVQRILDGIDQLKVQRAIA